MNDILAEIMTTVTIIIIIIIMIVIIVLIITKHFKREITTIDHPAMKRFTSVDWDWVESY